MTRIKPFLIALAWVASVAAFALPASDAFSGPNGDPLSGNWTTDTGGWQLSADSAQAITLNAMNFARWVTDTPGADQEASLELNGSYINAASGPCVRLTSSGNGYCLSASDFGGQDVSILRFDAFVNTSVGAAVFTSYTSGDVLRLRIVGSTLTPYKNGVAGATASDGTYSAAGNGGMFAYSVGGGDNFLLDNVGGGGPGGASCGSLLLLHVGCH